LCGDGYTENALRDRTSHFPNALRWNRNENISTNNAAVGYYDMLLLRYWYSVLFLSKEGRLDSFIFFKTINISGFKEIWRINSKHLNLKYAFGVTLWRWSRVDVAAVSSPEKLWLWNYTENPLTDNIGYDSLKRKKKLVIGNGWIIFN